MRRGLITATIVVLALVLVLSVAKDTIAKVSVEKAVELVTGLRLSMSSFNIGIIRTLVDIKDLVLYNPKGFEEKIMLDMPEIYVDYDLPAIAKGKVHLEEVRIDLKEFVVVKNDKGELNLDSLKVVRDQKEGAKETAVEKGKAPQVQIDKLELKIGKVVYKDYSKGAKPSVQEFDVNLDEEYRNVDDLNKLVSLIVVKALSNTTIARLTNFDLKGLQGSVSDTLATAQKVTAQVATKAQETVSATSQKTAEVMKGAAETVKETTENLTDTIKLPFGAKKK